MKYLTEDQVQKAVNDIRTKHPSALMFSSYQRDAMRTAKVEEDTLVDNLVHASLGIITESGEFVSEVKRMARYGKEMTPEMHAHMCEELGDVMWYLSLACTALGVQMGDLALANVEKLRKRFPDKYTDEAAEARADKGGLPHTQS